ncbi:MAG: MarR family transcriptional regulator [Desulfobacteraceae bacterium]|nr:MarR family transcriptional regulator [Desulfobacteraceae bacterium]
MRETEKLLHNCLFFTANSIARKITRMAEQEFRFTGLSPSHAFILMLVYEKPGIRPKLLCEYLNLAPSTITRFVDALKYKGYLTKKTSGKNTSISITDEGAKIYDQIAVAWTNLYLRYSDILGEQECTKLTDSIDLANKML